MSSGLSHSDQWTAVLLALLITFSLPALYGTAAATGPDPIDDDTPMGEASTDDSTDNTTTEQSKESTTSTDASVWETAGQALPGDAILAREQLALARELRSISDDSSKSDRAKALDTANTILEQRKGWAASQDRPLPSSLVQRIETQKAKLDAASELLETAEETRDDDSVARAVDLAKQGTTIQAAQADDSVTLESGLPAVETPGYESPSAVTRELLDRYGITPTAADLATMQELDDMSEPVRSELTDFLNAYLAFQSATAEDDVTKTFAARNQMLDEVQDLNEALQSTDGPGLATPQHDNLPTGGTGITQQDGKTQIGCVNRSADTPKDNRFEDQSYHFCVLQFGDSTGQKGTRAYTDNTVVLIDVGGDDEYHNNAGGTNLDDNCDGPVQPPSIATSMLGDYGEDRVGDISGNTPGRADGDVAGAHIDFGGDDTYTRASGIGCGQRGGAEIGSGFLVDAGGSDTYGNVTAYNDAHMGTNGGANALLPDNNKGCCREAIATGFLLDIGPGADTYMAGGLGANGGAADGDYHVFGFLMDTKGPSTYNATAGGTNGGGVQANGFLADFGSSDDTYEAEAKGTNGGGIYQSKYGGFLLDAGGTDKYHATSQGTNGGGAQRANGFLLDAGKNNHSRVDPRDNFTTGHAYDPDIHNPSSYETGPVSRQAGLMGVNGGGRTAGVGVLVDVAGGSLYKTGDGQGANGGAFEFGSGNLVDGDGDDTYISGFAPTAGTTWNNTKFSKRNLDPPQVRLPSAGSNGGGATGGVGSISDSGGDNTYRVTDGHLDGDNLYYSGVNATNGGGWALGTGGVGFLTTTDGQDTYNVTVEDGLATGVNGGGSGYGSFTSTGVIGSVVRLNREVNHLEGPAFRATGTLVDTDSRPNKGEKYIVKATGSGPKIEDVAGANGGAHGNASVGILVDAEGDDDYTAVGANASLGVNGGAHNPLSSVPGVGLLLDAAGGDTYEQNCNEGNPAQDDTWAPKGNAPVTGTGAQIDLDDGSGGVPGFDTDNTAAKC